MDSVQHRCDVHLRHLLIHSQVNPKLRPVNAWDSVSLWRYRRQRWRFVRRPLLQRYVQPTSASSVPLGAMGGPLDGAILFFCGYFLIWASVVGMIQRPVPVPLMCLFIFMAAQGQGQNFFNTTDVVTRLINFGDYGGTIVGIFNVYTCGSALFCQQFLWIVRVIRFLFCQGLYWSEWRSADPSPSVRNNMHGQSKHLNSVSDSCVPFAYGSGSNLWHKFTWWQEALEWFRSYCGALWCLFHGQYNLWQLALILNKGAYDFGHNSSAFTCLAS